MSGQTDSRSAALETTTAWRLRQANEHLHHLGFYLYGAVPPGEAVEVRFGEPAVEGERYLILDNVIVAGSSSPGSELSSRRFPAPGSRTESRIRPGPAMPEARQCLSVLSSNGPRLRRESCPISMCRLQFSAKGSSVHWPCRRDAPADRQVESGLPCSSGDPNSAT